jgi:hypothetical protein
MMFHKESGFIFMLPPARQGRHINRKMQLINLKNLVRGFTNTNNKCPATLRNGIILFSMDIQVGLSLYRAHVKLYKQQLELII